jgi:ABC-2 type transport system permease protein
MKRVISTELRKIIAYRSDFWVNFLGQMLLQLFIARALWLSIFTANNVTHMGGFDLAQITLYYLLAPLTMKILMGEGLGTLASEIYNGGLNRYLVWPMPPLGYKLLTYFTHSFFYMGQLCLLYTIARLYLVDAPYAAEEFLRLIAGLCFLSVAVLAYFCLQATCDMMAFWAENVWSLAVMLRFTVVFLGGVSLPLSFFPDQMRAVLEFLPFAAMTSGPINLILGRSTFSEAFGALMVLILWLPVMAGVMRWVWRRGNLKYTGVGM